MDTKFRTEEQNKGLAFKQYPILKQHQNRHNIPLASYLQFLHEKLLPQHSSLGHLELGKLKETTFQPLPCNHVLQQALPATYPTDQQKKR